MRTPLFLKLDQKMVIFRGVSTFFSELLDSNSLVTSKKSKVGVVLGKNLGQIRSNVVKTVKK